MERALPPSLRLPVTRIHRTNMRWWRIGLELFLATGLVASWIDGVFGSPRHGIAHAIEITGIIVGAVVVVALQGFLKWGVNRRLISRGSPYGQFFVGRATARSIGRQGDPKPLGDITLDLNGITFKPDMSELISVVNIPWTDVAQIDVRHGVDSARMRLTMSDRPDLDFNVRDSYGLTEALQALADSAGQNTSAL